MLCLVYSEVTLNRSSLMNELIIEGKVYEGEQVRVYNHANEILRQLRDNWGDIGAVVFVGKQGDEELIIGACHEVDNGTTPIPIRRLREGLLETVGAS